MTKFHVSYIVWLVVYMLLSWLILGASWMSLGITVGIYALSIGIALSPYGEKLLRFAEGVREPVTQYERKALIPLFKEVDHKAWKACRIISHINIYITDKMTINAFAMGRRTICVTRGAMEMFTPEQLKGIIAHEYAHIINRDTTAGLLNYIGNGIFTLLLLLFRVIFFVLDMLSMMTENLSPLKLITGFVKFLFDASIATFMSVGQIILAMDKRMSEYRADQFAYEIGYGLPLIEALYILQKISLNKDMKLTDRLKQSHPYLGDRIERLESFEHVKAQRRFWADIGGKIPNNTEPEWY